MEARFRRAEWDAQGARGLGQRHPQEEVQDDDGSPCRVEPTEGVVDELALDDSQGGIRNRRTVDRLQLDLDGSRTPAAQAIDAGSNEESMEPSVEPIRVAQSGQVSPCPNERFLDRVAGKLPIPEDQARGCVQPRNPGADEHGEGVMIAPPGPFHESSLVHGASPFRRGRSGALGW